MWFIRTAFFVGVDCTDLANWIFDVLDSIGFSPKVHGNSEEVIAATKVKVAEICKRLPVYG